MSGARVIGIGLLVLGLVCGVVSTALDYWYYFSSVTYKDLSFKTYFGLWEFCVTGTHASKCLSWKDMEDVSGALDLAWLHACQAMMIIGVVVNAAACGAAIYATVKQMTLRPAQVAAAICGVCYLIASAIFGNKYNNAISGPTPGNLHAGFGLAIVAGLINLISTCVLVRSQTGGSYNPL